MRTPFRKSHGKITFVLYNKPSNCKGKCIYCFSQKGYTKSTTANEDTTLAKESSWNGRKQLEKRFEIYQLKKDSGIKCDFAVKGDSFASHDEDYLLQYSKEMYDFLNNRTSESLEEAVLLQNEAKDKCVTYKVETRPDQIDENKCLFFAKLGITTVEIGVQSLDDDVLRLNNRGHDSSTVMKTTQLLKRFGFEVCYQIMIGLPFSNLETDKKMLTETLWKNEYAPDALKIYPCLLLKESYVMQKKLRNLYLAGIWKPLNTHDYTVFLEECYPHIPNYVHINRIQRIIPPEKIDAGPASEINRKIFSNISKCLWQRSINNYLDNWNINVNNYTIKEYLQGANGYCFESVLGNDIVLGYSRLNLISKKSALIRDVRVLGDMLLVGQKNEEKIGCQHIGIGTALLNAMEEKARDNHIEFIFIKPAAGSKNWFISRGYIYINEYYLVKIFAGNKEQAISEYQLQIKIS
jgi:elongator complex protein 3